MKRHEGKCIQLTATGMKLFSNIIRSDNSAGVGGGEYSRRSLLIVPPSNL